MTSVPLSTAQAIDQQVDQYLPSSEREGIGLCLSGGGYRATLFHLGALRRLNELGVLSRLRTIASVSGGSITAAHLATRLSWPMAGPEPHWESRVSGPLREFTRHNLRTPAMLRRLLPWNWFRSSTGVMALARSYEDLTRIALVNLPSDANAPNFVLCATDMAFGDAWVFEAARMGAYQPGYISPPPKDWPLARAVAASSCFPPIFNPMPLPFAPGEYAGGKAPSTPRTVAAIRGMRLTDGGNYDNLGLEPIWKDHATVLVSDGGAIFGFEADLSLFWRLNRYTAIVGNQALALRKRWLIANFKTNVMAGTYWGIGSARSQYIPGDSLGYTKALATEVIAAVRTDLDAFSEAEAAVLENHGYLLADRAIQTHVPALLPTPKPPLSIPHPQWMDETKVRNAMATSSKRTLLGRW